MLLQFGQAKIFKDIFISYVKKNKLLVSFEKNIINYSKLKTYLHAEPQNILLNKEEVIFFIYKEKYYFLPKQL